MNYRTGVMHATWLLLHRLGERQSRRTMQKYLGKITGKQWATNEVAAFLRTWQYQDEYGNFRVREALGPLSVPERDQPRSNDRAQNGDSRSSLGPIQVQSRSAHARGTIEKETERETPPYPPEEGDGAERLEGGSLETAGTTKRIQIPKPPIAPVTFEAQDEHRTQTMLAAIAAANASGLISPDRVLRLRAEMRAKLDEVGPERWRYGMDQANAKEAARPWDYAKGVIRNHTEVPKPKLAPWEAAERKEQARMERLAQRDFEAQMQLVHTNGKSHG